MTRQVHRCALLLLTLVLPCCSASSSKYRETLAAADASARQQRPEEAAQLYQKAAQETDRPDLAVEAAYREAWMWKKAGDSERALSQLEELIRAAPHSARSPRIWLDIGRLREAKGREAGAREAYRRVLDYPDSGLAPRAADALVNLMPGAPSSSYRTLLQTARASPAFDSFLRLRIARAEAAEGLLKNAIATCEGLAQAYPLPTGVYTDEALLLAARLRRILGDQPGALITLDALLAAQEKAALVGSYERPAFAEARWLAADIYQHDLDDGAAAERMLDDLAGLSPTSRLRDDALFRAAWLAHHQRQDHGSACRRARQVAALDPPSPLTECLGEVCESMNSAVPRSRRCERAVAMARGSDLEQTETPRP